MRTIITTALLASVAALATPASAAVTNLILNGSFEKGFSHFTYSSGTAEAYPAVVIDYNKAAAYGTNGGAFGESVPTSTIVSPGGDAAGTHAAYFVDDAATNESLSQVTKLAVGNYQVGFSVYLPYNGAANPNDATFVGKILDATIASFSASSTAAGTWYTFSGVAGISKAGNYTTSFVYNTPGTGAAKDIVIDQVYAIATNAPATVLVPPTSTVPEAATWVLMVAGFGLVGASLRRRKVNVVAA